MAHDWTAAALLTEIRRRGKIPANEPDYTDAALLLEADSQILELFVPLITSARSDFYVRYEDQTLAADTAAYPIPYRALASTIRQILWIDSAGREHELNPVESSDQWLYSAQTGHPREFAVRDDEIIVLPTPASALGTLRVFYEYRPAKLVTSGYYTVSSKTSTAVVLGSSVTWTASSLYDFVKARPPFALLGVDADPTGTGSSTTVTFPSSAIPSRLAQGDYMCLPGESPVPQIPAELHPTLALAVAAEVVSQYAPAEAGALYAKLTPAMVRAETLIEPRSHGKSMKVRNRSSYFRRSGGRRSFLIGEP